jgi:hypothetical protein
MKKLLLLLFFYTVQSSAALHDPTRPPQTKDQEPYVVNQILISAERTNAVINNKIYHVGDKIYDSTVIAIHKNEVKLSGPEGSVTLKLLSIPLKP